jgi:hypothetical protein
MVARRNAKFEASPGRFFALSANIFRLTTSRNGDNRRDTQVKHLGFESPSAPFAPNPTRISFDSVA